MGLVPLLIIAFKIYREHICTAGASYAGYLSAMESYDLELLISYTPPDESTRHCRINCGNIRKMIEMLYNHQSHVEHFFVRDSFAAEDAIEMLECLFNMPKGTMGLSHDQFERLAEIANRFGLFTISINAQHLESIFHGKGEALRLSGTNQSIGVFLSPLIDKNLLFANWAKLIGNGMVIIGKNDKIIDSSILPILVSRAGTAKKHEKLFLAVQNFASSVTSC